MKLKLFNCDNYLSGLILKKLKFQKGSTNFFFEPKLKKVGKKLLKSIKIIFFQNSGNRIRLKMRQNIGEIVQFSRFEAIKQVKIEMRLFFGSEVSGRKYFLSFACLE
jgi:hypothetical protein